ncbi:hypothetical protein LHFGNBLO_006076 (plasmid) [Mesorhizobium sp. AR10]|nr:hypothetical protein [Mesorhizobium sp. AR10]UVK35849.1 hypothetical protein LHFGNBLO_006076 [Mesorhizobium sp. AR10]
MAAATLMLSGVASKMAGANDELGERTQDGWERNSPICSCASQGRISNQRSRWGPVRQQDLQLAKHLRLFPERRATACLVCQTRDALGAELPERLSFKHLNNMEKFFLMPFLRGWHDL